MVLVTREKGLELPCLLSKHERVIRASFYHAQCCDIMWVIGVLRERVTDKVSALSK